MEPPVEPPAVVLPGVELLVVEPAEVPVPWVEEFIPDESVDMSALPLISTLPLASMSPLLDSVELVESACLPELLPQELSVKAEPSRAVAKNLKVD